MHLWYVFVTCMYVWYVCIYLRYASMLCMYDMYVCMYVCVCVCVCFNTIIPDSMERGRWSSLRSHGFGFLGWSINRLKAFLPRQIFPLFFWSPALYFCFLMYARGRNHPLHGRKRKCGYKDGLDFWLSILNDGKKKKKIWVF